MINRATRQKRQGFGLLELLVIMGVVALAVVLSYPGYKRAGLMEKAKTLRADLQDIEQAVAGATRDLKAPPGSMLTLDQLRKYLKPGTSLQKAGHDPFGHPYGHQRNDAKPQVPAKSAELLRGVVPEGFWGSYQVSGEL